MFALFVSLYYAMFTGTWSSYSLDMISRYSTSIISKVGTFITSIFGEFQVTDLGDTLTMENTLFLASIILALITSIGIVVMAVKGVKKAFGIFFGQIR